MSDMPSHPSTVSCKVLMFLLKAGESWCTFGPCFYMPTVQGVFRIGTTKATQLRFMQAMQRKGLVGGCDCGCRGDYTITDLGLKILEENCIHGKHDVKEFRKKYPNGVGY